MPLNKIRTLVYSCALIGYATTVSAQTIGSTHHSDIYNASIPINTQTYSVDLNKTQIVHLPQKAGAIVVGNPAVADISVHSDKTIFVIGRGYGETNVMVLNTSGQVVMNANIQVINALPSNGVRVYKGSSGERNTYNCAPYCNPAPVLGDSGSFISSNQGSNIQINNQVANTSSVTSTPRTFDSFGASLQEREPLVAPLLTNPTSRPTTLF